MEELVKLKFLFVFFGGKAAMPHTFSTKLKASIHSSLFGENRWEGFFPFLCLDNN